MTTIKESLQDLRESLKELEDRLAEKKTKIDADAEAPAEGKAKIEAFEAKAAAVKAKLPAEEGSVWQAIKNEVNRDLNALSQDLEHTVNYIDEHYGEKK